MYIKRYVEQTILDAAASFPCIVIYGPRQVGKSTTINMLFGDKIPMVTLDDADDRALAINNPRLFLEQYGWPVIIDEIQKAPNLLDEIKIKIDEQRLVWLRNNEKRQIMYILTGSNRFELQEGISDSLAGRCGVIEMLSLSQAEKYAYPNNLFSADIQKLIALERSKKFLIEPGEKFIRISLMVACQIFSQASLNEIFISKHMSIHILKKMSVSLLLFPVKCSSETLFLLSL